MIDRRKFLLSPVVASVASLWGCRRGKPSSEHPEREDAGASLEAWEFVERDDGVVVSRQPSDQSPLPIYRSIGCVDAPLLEVLAVVSDAERHHEWVFRCSASELLEQLTELTGVTYNRTAVPWPVPDRDVVVTSGIELLDSIREVLVSFDATTHKAKPPLEGVVRISYMRGYFRLWRDSEARTGVEYTVDVDPGGALPDWLAIQGARIMTPKTLHALRGQVTRTRGDYDDLIVEQLERLEVS